MKTPTPIPLPVTRSLHRLGLGISLARRRRHLSQQDLAQRIGTSVITIRRMEAGHPGIALQYFVRALHVFGELEQLNQLLDTSQDSIGLTLMDAKLPQRIRKLKSTTETGSF